MKFSGIASGIPVLLVLLCAAAASGAEPAPTISPGKTDREGITLHAVQSPFQAGKTDIRVLLPEKIPKKANLRVIYLLPVEAGRETRYGDGLAEVKKHHLHNRFGVVFVAPSFSHLPWYADHPTRPELRQETYLLQVVVPFIEKTYPVAAEPSGRLLLGFSKSGWGAFSLLLRHPEVFGRAVAWDAPLTMAKPDKYGMGDIFGTQENFEKYRITRLIEEKTDLLRKENRLILSGIGNFRDHHEKTHALLEQRKIPHGYRDSPVRKHDWHSGWVTDSVEMLLEPAAK